MQELLKEREEVAQRMKPPIPLPDGSDYPAPRFHLDPEPMNRFVMRNWWWLV
jgi:hypothetical protein